MRRRLFATCPMGKIKTSVKPHKKAPMKNKTKAHTIVFALLLFAGMATSRAQNLSGTDNFNASIENSNWGTDVTYGSGALTQTNSYLQFTSAGTGANGDYSGRPWVANYGSYTQNWSVQLDTTVLLTTSGAQTAAFGLEIWDAANTSQYVGIEDGSSGGSAGYYTYLGNGDNNVSATAAASGPTVGAVKITYDALTKVITTYYDPNSPGEGYNWVVLGSYGLAGSGGVTGNVNWDLGPDGTFIAAPFGFTQSVAATSGEVYGDNFLAVPEPRAWTMVAGGFAILFGFQRLHRPGIRA